MRASDFDDVVVLMTWGVSGDSNARLGRHEGSEELRHDYEEGECVVNVDLCCCVVFNEINDQKKKVFLSLENLANINLKL